MLTFIVFLVSALATYDRGDAVSGDSILSSLYQADTLVYPPNEEIKNACGNIGATISDLLIHVFGIGALYLVVGLISLVIKLFQQRKVPSPFFKTFGWVLSLMAVTSLGTLTLSSWSFGPVIGPGGYLGALTAGLLHLNFGTVGAFMFSFSAMLVGVMMWTEYLAFRAGRLMFAPAAVAAASLLPFGLLHRFMKSVNGDGEEEGDEELDEEFEDDEDEIEEFLRNRERPARIKIRRGLEEESEEELEGEEEVEAEESEPEAETEEVAEPEVEFRRSGC